MKTSHIYQPGSVVAVSTAPVPYDGPPWPAPLNPAAFHGLAGEIVKRIEPHTESDPAALLAQFLLAFGNAAGRRAHWLAEETPHFTNEFAVIVGQSSIARKGTSLDWILALFADADLYWRKNRIGSGLVSGQGVVHAIRDAKQNAEGEVEDEGVSDKRLLVTEGEFASVLSEAAFFVARRGSRSSVLAPQCGQCTSFSPAYSAESYSIGPPQC